MQRHQPDIYRRVWKFLGFEDFVYFQLGIPPVVDYSLAARTMMFDIIDKSWSEKMLGLGNVDASLLPDTAPSGTIIGEVSPKIADELGLPRGVVGVTGGHDQPCGAMGAGIIRSGEVMDATGTVECIAPAFTEPVINQAMSDGNFACYPHVVNGLYVTLGFVSSGGVVLRWYRDTFAQAEIAQAAAEGTRCLRHAPRRDAGYTCHSDVATALYWLRDTLLGSGVERRDCRLDTLHDERRARQGDSGRHQL